MCFCPGGTPGRVGGLLGGQAHLYPRSKCHYSRTDPFRKSKDKDRSMGPECAFSVNGARTVPKQFQSGVESFVEGSRGKAETSNQSRKQKIERGAVRSILRYCHFSRPDTFTTHSPPAVRYHIRWLVIIGIMHSFYISSNPPPPDIVRALLSTKGELAISVHQRLEIPCLVIAAISLVAAHKARNSV